MQNAACFVLCQKVSGGVCGEIFWDAAGPAGGGWRGARVNVGCAARVNAGDFSFLDSWELAPNAIQWADLGLVIATVLIERNR